MVSAPTLVAVKGGWVAVAEDWAVFGNSKEDALHEFERAIVKHEEILQRPVSGQAGNNYNSR